MPQTLLPAYTPWDFQISSFSRIAFLYLASDFWQFIGTFGKGEIVAIPPEQCYPGFEYFIIIQKVGADFRKYSSEFQLLMPLALHILPMAGVLDL